MNTERELAEVLAPCPFCGGTVIVPGGSPGHMYFSCAGCNAEGPYNDFSEEGAIAAWNRRPALLSRADGGEAPRAVRGMPPFGQTGVPEQ